MPSNHDELVNGVNSNDSVGEVDSVNKMNASIDSLIRDILTSSVDKLMENKKKELDEVLERQLAVKQFHDLMAKINKLTDKDGKVKVDEELERMLYNALKNNECSEADNAYRMSDLKFLEKGKEYKTEERQRLLENIRMHVEDLTTQNDMQMNKVTHLTNQTYEIYQSMRSIPKPGEEAKRSMIRNVAGR